LIGLGIAAGSAFLLLQASEALNQMLHFDTVQSYMATPALIAGIITCVIASFGEPSHPFGVGFGIYTIVRAILNVLRSIEPLIMGIVFVVWVSLGPFAGIMALTLHSIAALGKLFSEQVEGIDEGPVEAVTATGASRLQVVTYAVIPQIVPSFTAFALYRWDINVRMSTIIGFVGGGGIGFVLSQNIRNLRYRQASVMMLAIAMVVAALDYASAKIRSRII
jgi:phosphonate transport system permease protein